MFAYSSVAFRSLDWYRRYRFAERPKATKLIKLRYSPLGTFYTLFCPESCYSGKGIGRRPQRNLKDPSSYSVPRADDVSTNNARLLATNPVEQGIEQSFRRLVAHGSRTRITENKTGQLIHIL